MAKEAGLTSARFSKEKGRERAKRDNPRFSNFRPIAGHAPNGRRRGGMGSQACRLHKNVLVGVRHATKRERWLTLLD
jgi:hypothetical protein